MDNSKLKPVTNSSDIMGRVTARESLFYVGKYVTGEVVINNSYELANWELQHYGWLTLDSGQGIAYVRIIWLGLAPAIGDTIRLYGEVTSIEGNGKFWIIQVTNGQGVPNG